METGFWFLAPLIPLLSAGAAEVVGGALSAAGFLAVQAAMSPRSAEEQQAAIDALDDANAQYLSKLKWIAQVAQLQKSVEGKLTGTRRYEGDGVITRTYAILNSRITDVEREAIFYTARLKIGELIAEEARAGVPTTPNRATGSGGTSPTTAAPAPPGEGVAQSVQPSGGMSLGGTSLIIGGLGLAAFGLWWASQKKGRR